MNTLDISLHFPHWQEAIVARVPGPRHRQVVLRHISWDKDGEQFHIEDEDEGKQNENWFFIVPGFGQVDKQEFDYITLAYRNKERIERERPNVRLIFQELLTKWLH